jgi:hypothetical protein
MERPDRTSVRRVFGGVEEQTDALANGRALSVYFRSCRGISATHGLDGRSAIRLRLILDLGGSAFKERCHHDQISNFKDFFADESEISSRAHLEVKCASHLGSNRRCYRKYACTSAD